MSLLIRCAIAPTSAACLGDGSAHPARGSHPRVADDVLITGATGFVGSAILDRLVARGSRVRAHTRTPEGETTLRERGAEPVRGDILDRPSLRTAFEGANVVYHVAGANAFCLPDPSPLYSMNVDGTRAVVDAAADAGVRRIVYTSSAATIGEATGVHADETTPHRGEFLSHYERSKWEAEIVALETADRRASSPSASTPPASRDDACAEPPSSSSGTSTAR